jgi:hypothetical protein
MSRIPIVAVTVLVVLAVLVIFGAIDIAVR